MKDSIYGTLLQLTACPSITESEEERDMAKIIYGMLQDIPYFQAHPEHLLLHRIDKENLYAVMALLKHPVPKKKTAILISHFDVVGVEEYGFLKEYAFDPETYTHKLRDIHLPEEAQKDLHSGEWLFGRGTMDMKCGLAIHMELLQYYSGHFDALDCNLLLLTVPDEEGNSKGMLGCGEKLVEWANIFELDFHILINSEPIFPLYEGDTRKHIYTGSVGKLLPMFFCVGKETHVGEPYGGFNPHILLSEIHKQLEVNPKYCEKHHDFVCPPPTCLKQKDLKESYSVQIPRTAVAYYNWILLKDDPQTVLKKMTQIAEASVKRVLSERKERIEHFQALSSYAVADQSWNIVIKTFEEIYDRVLDTHGQSFQNHLNHKISQWIKENILDSRELTIKIVDEVCSYYPDKNPLVVLLFAPPYYPSAWNQGNSEKECTALKAAKNLVDYSQNTLDTTLSISPFFPGLSDSSYFGIKKGTKIADALMPNMPVWNRTYQLPLEALEQLDIPVINISTFGKDAHKYTERLHLPFSLEITPKMIMYYLENL